MKMLKIFLLCCLLTGGSCGKRQMLRNSTGDIDARAKGDNSYQIRVSKGNRIVFSLETLQLGSGASLTFTDGKYGEEQIYTMGTGSSVYKRYGRSRHSTRVWSLPTTIETTTAKLFITVRGTSDGDGFTAHYTSYPSNGCWKDQVADDFEFDDFEKSCDTDELSPTAVNCELTIPCEDNYVQYNKGMTCVSGSWVGKIECQPDGDLIKRCSHDFDEFTTNEGCPFSNTEVALYYINVEGADVFEPSLGRSSAGNRINCRPICAHGSRGTFIQQCPDGYYDRRSLALYVRCFICRVVHGCGGGGVIVFA